MRGGGGISEGFKALRTPGKEVGLIEVKLVHQPYAAEDGKLLDTVPFSCLSSLLNLAAKHPCMRSLLELLSRSFDLQTRPQETLCHCDPTNPNVQLFTYLLTSPLHEYLDLE